MKSLPICLSFVLLVLAACERPEQNSAKPAEDPLYCLDHLCKGDVVPTHDDAREFTFKLDGQWFIGPREYGRTERTAAFFWPSKTPVGSLKVGTDAPEFRPASSKDQPGNFDDVSVEIFLHRRGEIQQSPTEWDYLQQIQFDRFTISKEVMYAGLELWRVHEEDHQTRPLAWYVASNIIAPDGQPPVLRCDENNPDSTRCNAVFLWQGSIVGEIRLHARHAPDWPEIYQEAMRVLLQFRKAPLG